MRSDTYTKSRRMIGRRGSTNPYVPLALSVAAFITIMIVLLVIGQRGRTPRVYGGSPQVGDSSGTSPASSTIPASWKLETKRCVSLSALQRRLDAGEKSDELMKLCGLTFVEGAVIDPERHDVILFGPKTPGPPLGLDDLVVALRNVWSDDGSPGCSIDPRPATLQALNTAMKRAAAAQTESQINDAIDHVLAIGRGPQTVRVINVPKNTSFFKALVDADYHTKRVANGTHPPKVDGFQCLATDVMEANKAATRKGKPAPCSSIMSRFWFTPGELEVYDYANTLLLKSCPVKLLTEQEYTTKSGELVGANAAEPFSERFVNSFTKRFDDIAAAERLYCDLRSMFRFVGIAQAFNYYGAFQRAGLDAGCLLKRHKVSPVAVPSELPGIADVLRATVPVSGGEARLWLMSIGGVDIGITPDQTWRKLPAEETRRKMQFMSDTAKSGHPPGNPLYWDVSGPVFSHIRLPKMTRRPWTPGASMLTARLQMGAQSHGEFASPGRLRGTA